MKALSSIRRCLRLKILITGGTGYIGSRVYDHLRFEHEVLSVDLELFNSNLGYKNRRGNFRSVLQEILDEQDVIVHLAGHSSVPWCEKDQFGSLKNNCLDFFKFVKRLKPTQKIIYASSGSVYGSCDDHRAKETDKLPPCSQSYDAQKQLIDLFMEDQQVPYYGLRFGTVCGYSKNPRNELMINSMVRSAVTRGYVQVTGADKYRAILGLSDLCTAIRLMVESEAPSGFYNLASFNMRIGDIGKAVADTYGVELRSIAEGGNSYSFCLDTGKFCDLLDYDFRETVRKIAMQCSQNDINLERKWDQKL
jgi:nucleoside-diphosphate-sugar epimerase